ncbi:MAG: hypothetical protein ABI835_04620 [Chloroflexota bacterium]
MKIAFIFTDQPDLAQVPSDNRYSSYFELPDAAKSLPDIQAQIIAIGEIVGQFTNVSLHISCRDIGLKNYPIEQRDEPTRIVEKLFYNRNAMCLYFEPDGHKYWHKRTLKIYSPLSLQFPRWGSGDKGYYQVTLEWTDPSLNSYVERVRVLSEQLLALLNTDSNWHFLYFHPFLWQNSLATLHKRRSRKWNADLRKSEREEEKRKARAAKLAEKLASAPPQQPLTHGAGRTVGARPGIYKGVQMRSQLEIRFAAELDERSINWVYEGEALSDSSYLVDFYLPDLGVWVEVKGRFEARDRQVLPEVARILKAERKHRLLVYTGAGMCCVVNPSGFREVERKNFWSELLR